MNCLFFKTPHLVGDFLSYVICFVWFLGQRTWVPESQVEGGIVTSLGVGFQFLGILS